jgi:hypothetical protein
MPLLLALPLLLAPPSLAADPEPPAEVRALLAPGEEVLSWAAADLNRDGTPDVVLIAQPVGAASADMDSPQGKRSLRVATRDATGKLSVAARSEKAVLCSACGGVMGDPFNGLEAQAGGFWIRHYGGSGGRWARNFRFAYSRKQTVWQLVEVQEEDFHAAEPDKGTSRRLTPPKHYGRVDLGDFDPERYEGVGPR